MQDTKRIYAKKRDEDEKSVSMIFRSHLIWYEHIIQQR